MNKDILELDGAIGGGQVLRTALSLSMITGTPFVSTTSAPNAAGRACCVSI